MLLAIAPSAAADDIGCAADGLPQRQLQPSAALALALFPYAGSQASRLHGDLTDEAAIAVQLLRLSLCGKVATRRGSLHYHLGYEAWNLMQRARSDAPTWGRLFVAEIGFAPLPYLGFRIGIFKPVTGFGHDEPEFSLVLPRSHAVLALSTDRRLGLEVSAPFGAISAAVAIAFASRDAPLLRFSDGLVASGRLRADPIGPMGSALSTLDDEASFGDNFRFSIGAGGQYQYSSLHSGYAFSVDGAIKWKLLSALIEYHDASQIRSDLDGGLHTGRGLGVTTAVLAVRPYLECALRYEWFAEAQSSATDPARFHALQLGLSSYPFKRWVKLQAHFAHRFYTGVPRSDDVLSLGAIFSQ